MLMEGIEKVRPLFNFTLLEDKKEEKLIILENEKEEFPRFDYQQHEPLVLRKYINLDDDSVISLENLILSLKMAKQLQKEREVLQIIKTHLLNKLCKHISWELYLLDRYSGLEYPELNVTTVLFNIEKEFFFLSSEPVIVRHLLGYQNRPTTKANFFADERFHKIERVAKMSSETGLEENGMTEMKQRTFLRLMKLLSSLDCL